MLYILCCQPLPKLCASFAFSDDISQQLGRGNSLQLNYCVYGLQLNANVEIPGLQPCETTGDKADVVVTMGSFPEEIVHLINQQAKPYYIEPGYDKTDPPHLIVNMLADGKYYHFRYGTGAQFVCNRQATVVWGSWKNPFILEDAALYLLGPILGFILRLRGTTCLHASGVVVGKKALALAGASGAGKSTLAAAFAASGYPILTDDVLPLKIKDGTQLALSGYARMRLYPHSFQNMDELPNDLPLLAPNWDKCYLDLASAKYSFHKKAVPLKVVYLLDWSNDNTTSPKIIPVKPTTAVLLLAANTYRNELLDLSMKKKEFYFLSRFVSQVLVRRIQLVDDIAEISHLLEIIIDDFRKI